MYPPVKLTRTSVIVCTIILALAALGIDRGRAYFSKDVTANPAPVAQDSHSGKTAPTRRAGPIRALAANSAESAGAATGFNLAWLGAPPAHDLSAWFAFAPLATIPTVPLVTFTTITNGNWSSPSTWAGGMVPTATIAVADTVNIGHVVTYDLTSDLQVFGVVNITNGTFRTPFMSGNGFGRSVFIRTGGKWNMSGSEFYLPLFSCGYGCTTGSALSGNFVSENGMVTITSSKVEIAQNWEDTSSPGAGRMRTVTGGCLKVGENLFNKGSVDLYDTTCIEIGLHGSGNFKNEHQITFQNSVIIKLVGGGNFENVGSGPGILGGASAIDIANFGIANGTLTNDRPWSAQVQNFCIAPSVGGSGVGGSMVADFTTDVTNNDTPAACTAVNAANCNSCVAGVPPTCMITGPDAVCAGSTGNIYTAMTDGVSPTFSWMISGNGTIVGSTTGSSVTVTAGAAGSFTLSVMITSGGLSSTCMKTVTVNATPVCSITGADAVCAGSTGNIFTGPAGANLSYMWSISGNGTIVGSTTSQSVTVTAGAAGSFTLTLTVTDTTTQCSSTCMKTMTVNAVPVATITAPAAVCAFSAGNMASVPDAGPGATYVWMITNGMITAGQGTNAITFTAGASGPVMLSVTVTNAAGCSASSSTQVTVNPLPSCTITGADAVCAGSTGNIFTGPAGANLSYMWSISGNGTIVGSTTSQSVTVTAGAAGSFTLTLTVTDTTTQCSSTCMKTVTVNAVPVATITAPAAVCAFSAGNMASVPDAGPGATYVWMITNGMITAGQGTNAITFTAGASGPVMLGVTVTNAAGCSATGSTQVTVNPLPSCTITGADAVCAGSTGNIFTGPAGANLSYMWSITGNGMIIGSTTSQSVTVTAGAAGSFTLTLTVTDTTTQCSSTCMKTVTVNAVPIATITAPAAVCALSTGNMASVPDAGVGATYVWMITNGMITAGQGTNAITFTAGASGPIMLSVMVTNAAGCSASSSTQVTVNPLPSCTITGADAVCAGSTGNIFTGPAGANLSYMGSISGNGTIVGSTTSQSVTVTAGAAGSFTLTLTVTDTTTQCSSTCMKTVTVNAVPIATITAPAAVCALSTGNMASVPDAGVGATYVWMITNGMITAGQGTNAITFTAGASGPIMLGVTVTNAAGCSASSSTQVTVNPLPSCTITGADAVCAGSTGNIFTGPAGAILSYMWSISGNGTIVGSTTSQSVTVTAGAAGSFTLTLTVTDTTTQCSSTCMKTVTVNAVPVATITAPGMVCALSAGNMASVPDAGPGATYVWMITNGTITAGQGTRTITFTAGASGPITLSVTVTSAAGCSASSTFTIGVAPLPTAAAGPDQEQCQVVGSPTMFSLDGTVTNGTPMWSFVSSTGTIVAGDVTIVTPAAEDTSVIIAAGETGTVTLRLTATSTGEINCGTATDDVVLTVTPAATVNAGADQTVASCVASVQLNGAIGGSATSATWSGGTGTFSPNANTLNAQYIPSAAERAALAPIVLTLTTNDPPGLCGPVSDQVVINLTACADLSLTKTVNNSSPPINTNVTFTITLTNFGPNTATNVAVRDLLPAGLTFVSATPSQGSYNAATGIWTVGTLQAPPNPNTATLQITATVTAAGPANTAQVSASDQLDPDSTPNNNEPSEDDQAAVALSPQVSSPKGPGLPYPDDSEVSDQKAGSVLFYPIYTSNAANPNTQNTRISITNVDPNRAVAVHLFFVDGATCSIADVILCLTKNQTASFLASDLDPGVTGYIVAIASDLATGCPIKFNCLIGDLYVKFASGHQANLGAEAFSAIAPTPAACDGFSVTAQLNFDGVNYNRVPRTLAASSIPARADNNDTLLILNRFGGNLAIGAATLFNLFGILYDDAENGLSFTFNPGTCQFRSPLSNSFPRTTPRFENFIPAGRSGWLRLFSTSDIGLLGAILNFNPNASSSAGAFNQGRNLHKLTLTSTQTLIIPIFPPNCLD